MKRELIDEKYKWNIKDIFESEKDFYNELKKCGQKMN